MENDIVLPECAYQYFIEDALDREKLFTYSTLAYLYAENIGPVIMVCTERGYDFLVHHQLDEIYIDIIICEEERSVLSVIKSIEENDSFGPALFINDVQSSPENLRILYGNTNLSPEFLDRVRGAIDKEELKNII